MVPYIQLQPFTPFWRASGYSGNSEKPVLCYKWLTSGDGKPCSDEDSFEWLLSGVQSQFECGRVIFIYIFRGSASFARSPFSTFHCFVLAFHYRDLARRSTAIITIKDSRYFWWLTIITFVIRRRQDGGWSWIKMVWCENKKFFLKEM